MIDTLKKQIIESHKPVGVKKTSNWKLPPEEFAYGYKVKEDLENASIITRSWIDHKPSKAVEAQTDFIKVNKLAIEKRISDQKVRFFYSRLTRSLEKQLISSKIFQKVKS